MIGSNVQRMIISYWLYRASVPQPISRPVAYYFRIIGRSREQHFLGNVEVEFLLGLQIIRKNGKNVWISKQHFRGNLAAR